MRTLQEILDEFMVINSAKDLSCAERILQRDQTLFSAEFFDEALQNLNNGQYGHLVIWFLSKKLTLDEVDIDKLILQALEFLETCPTTVLQENSSLYCMLCLKITEVLVKKNLYKKGIPFLMKSIKAIQTCPSQMTSIHHGLYKLCLLAKYPKPALRFLDEDVSDIHDDETSVQDEYYLLYFYYGGMIYCSVGNYSRALYCFHSAITLFYHVISDIMVEASKKFILTSLLINQPNAIDDENILFIKKINEFESCRPYLELADKFQERNLNDLQSLFLKYETNFVQDTNLGLVKQVINSLITIKIQNLNKPFKTLSLQDLAAKVGISDVNEAEKFMFQMIEDGKLFATINKQNGMVTFLDNPEQFNTPQMYRRIEDEIKKCIELNDKFKQLDEDILTNPKYQQKAT